jgi:hypothetical protein
MSTTSRVEAIEQLKQQWTLKFGVRAQASIEKQLERLTVTKQKITLEDLRCIEAELRQTSQLAKKPELPYLSRSSNVSPMHRRTEVRREHKFPKLPNVHLGPISPESLPSSPGRGLLIASTNSSFVMPNVDQRRMRHPFKVDGLALDEWGLLTKADQELFLKEQQALKLQAKEAKVTLRSSLARQVAAKEQARLSELKEKEEDRVRAAKIAAEYQAEQEAKQQQRRDQAESLREWMDCKLAEKTVVEEIENDQKEKDFKALLSVLQKGLKVEKNKDEHVRSLKARLAEEFKASVGQKSKELIKEKEAMQAEEKRRHEDSNASFIAREHKKRLSFTKRLAKAHDEEGLVKLMPRPAKRWEEVQAEVEAKFANEKQVIEDRWRFNEAQRQAKLKAEKRARLQALQTQRLEKQAALIRARQLDLEAGKFLVEADIKHQEAVQQAKLKSKVKQAEFKETLDEQLEQHKQKLLEDCKMTELETKLNRKLLVNYGLAVSP